MIKSLVIGLIETYDTMNPFELCSSLHINVIFSDLDEIKGFYQRTEDGFEIIHINHNLSDDDKIYVCAHELGHALLHPDVSISFFIDNQLLIKNKYEIEADQFASELLIDENSIETHMLETLSTEQLASYLHVPHKLIEYKIKRMRKK